MSIQTLEKTKQCPQCSLIGNDKSQDNFRFCEKLAIWKCFACGHVEGALNQLVFNKKVESEQTSTSKEPLLTGGYYKEVIDRGITEQTCRDFFYQVLDIADQEYHIENYLDENNQVISQKMRYPQKDFRWHNYDKKTILPGIHLCKDYNKPIVITEGVIDAMSVYQEGYQACSIRGGSTQAKQDVLQYKQELSKYRQVLLWFDNDAPGKKATEECLQILPNAKIVSSIFKDANEVLLNNPNINAIKGILDYIVTPKGLIQSNNLDYKALRESKVKSIPIPWPELNKMLGGFEYGCMYFFLAGTGAGKTTVLRELSYNYIQTLPDLNQLLFFLEENEEVTPLAFAALHNSVPLGKLRQDRTLITDTQWEDIETNVLGKSNITFINKNFNRNSQNILDTIEYMVTQRGTELVILDHISYVIGRSGISKHGERRDVDEFIYALQDLVQRLGFILIAVSHINESESKKRWDQGEVPNIYSGRSSRVLAQVPDGIIGLARDLTNPNKTGILDFYNLKNRWFSSLGKADSVYYSEETGRMKSIDDLFGEE